MSCIHESNPALKADPLILISDLHLEPRREDITNALVSFLRGRACTASALYVLGDLFEVWIGDDAPNPLADQVAGEFSLLHDKGVEVFLLHGNRDFLIGNDFANRCKATLIHEPVLIERGEQRIALMHGDALCTRDVEYMRFRAMVRDPVWQRHFLEKSLDERVGIAREARDKSKKTTSMAVSEIMDVSQGDVLHTFTNLQINTLIHGHTHRPAIHPIHLAEEINGSLEAKRVVLGDWDSRGWYVEITENELSLHQFPFSA